MTETKHTPGPYSVREYAAEVQVIDPNLREIALVRRIIGTSGECPTELRIKQVANARLLAVAPQLLEAGQMLERGGMLACLCPDDRWFTCGGCLMRAAIAKAAGAQP